MSKHEKPMILRYWEHVGGTLLLEYHIVPRSPGVGRRLLDAVIIVDGERRIATPGEKISLDGHDLIIVQAKAYRLGMYLMGQALFSRVLIEDRFRPRSVRTVALCAIDDAVLRPMAEHYGIEVVADDLAGRLDKRAVRTFSRERRRAFRLAPPGKPARADQK